MTAARRVKGDRSMNAAQLGLFDRPAVVPGHVIGAQRAHLHERARPRAAPAGGADGGAVVSAALAIRPRDPDAIECPFAEGAWWGVWHWAEHPTMTRACDDLAGRLAPLRPRIVARCAAPLWTETLLRALAALAYVTREVTPALLLRAPRPARPERLRQQHAAESVAEELRRSSGGEELRMYIEGARAALTRAEGPGASALLFDLDQAWAHVARAAHYHDPDAMRVAGRCAGWVVSCAGSPSGSTRPELDTWEPAERLAGILAGLQ